MKNNQFWIFFKRRYKKDFFEAGSWFRKSTLSENKWKIQSNTKNHLAVVWTDGEGVIRRKGNIFHSRAQ